MERSGYQDEIDYWARELALDGAHVEYTRRRLDPAGRRGEHPLWIDGLVELLRSESDGRAPRAIDLGCGPLGTLGFAHESGALDVLGVDPLAEPYLELRRRFEIDYPMPLAAATGESLSAVARAESIDLVYARNSLDHAEDVQRCFEQVEAVLRPGGVFALEVFAYEGLREGYDGLHRFDFHVERGALGCTDQSGRDRLDLERSGLALSSLLPHETPRPVAIHGDTRTIRAVFVKSPDRGRIRRVAKIQVRSDMLERTRALLDPSGPFAPALARGLDGALLRALHPTWIDAALPPELLVGRTTPLRVLELECGPVPVLSWAQLDGVGVVEAAASSAADFAELLRDRALPEPPVRVRNASPMEVLRAGATGSIEVLHAHAALAVVASVDEFLGEAARVLVRGGVLVAECAADDLAAPRWRRRAGRAFDVVDGALVVCEDALGAEPTIVDLQARGLLPRSLERAMRDDPTEGRQCVVRALCERRG